MKRKSLFLLCSIFCGAILLSTTAELFSERGMKITIRTKTGKELRLYKDSHALVVGNGTYTHWGELPGALRDVDEVAKVLETHGFEVTVKKDLTKPEFDEIFAKFARVHGKGSDNRLFFYYAGHGHTEKLLDDRDRGYLVMVDAPLPEKDPVGFELSSVDMKSLITQVEKIQARHALFMFDSCFSGEILNTRNLAIPEHISDRVKHPVRQFITAGRADELVPDDSVFKDEFLNLLQGYAREPIEDGYITGEELGQYLKSSVPEYNKGQHPQYGKISNPKLDKGDFVFVLRDRTSSAKTESPGIVEPLETTAMLSVTSMPNHATIYIDNVRIGRTPLNKYEIDTGARRTKQIEVGLEHAGYKSRAARLTLRGGQDTPWNVHLEKLQMATQIYWISYDKIEESTTIKRTNLDGSNVQNLITESQLSDIALDVAGGKMYWTKAGLYKGRRGPPAYDGKIQRANLDGSNVEDLVTGLSATKGIALDVAGGKMYWVHGWNESLGDDLEIRRASLDGSNVETLTRVAGNPWSIALDVADGKMYWTHLSGSNIYRANLNGSNVEAISVNMAERTGIGGIALDVVGSKMYWVTRGANAGVWRANLDGSNTERLVTISGSPGYIALDIAGGKMYWTNYYSDKPDKIHSANLDGSNVETVATAGEFNSGGIALDIPSH